MKYLKTYEDFVNDTNRHQIATYDHSNSPVMRQIAQDYVQQILHSNNYKELFDVLNLEMPKDITAEEFDNTYSDLEERAIKYFIKHPEKMNIDKGVTDIKKVDASGGKVNTDGIPRISNTGATINNVPNVGYGVSNLQ